MIQTKDLQDRVNSLPKDPLSGVPDNDIAVYDAYKDAQATLAQDQRELERVSGLQPQSKAFATWADKAKLLLAKIPVGNQAQLKKLSLPDSQVQDVLNAKNNLFVPFAWAQLTFSPNPLEQLLNQASAKNGRESLLSSLAAQEKVVADQDQDQVDRKAALTSLVHWDQQRVTALVDKLNPKTALLQTGALTPYIVAIIGVTSILVILVIKLYPIELQMEWVASGQVTQFVTVMVLLSVVTCLAMAKIITENTVGTLLGGIGGYVLAQGVGRSAARQAERSFQDATAATRSPNRT